MKKLKPAVVLLFLFAAACGGVAPMDKTPENTATPSASAETAPVSGAEDVFSKTGKLYVHKGGGFKFPMLKDWEGQQSEEEARLTNPDKNLEIVVNRSNTGVELPHYALENFAFATENSFHAESDEYQLVNVISDAENKAVALEKTVKEGGKARYIYSQFIQKGPSVFTIEFSAPADDWELYRESFMNFADSIEMDGKLPEGTALYQVRKTYEAPGGFFTYQIPASFFVNRTTPKDKIIMDTFISPDQTATIQIVSFDSGELMNAATAEHAAIILLNELFEKGKGNINIDAIFTQKADGRQRMDWYSSLGKYAGSTYYELRGTFLILSTFSYEEESAELYAPLMKDLAGTYGAR